MGKGEWMELAKTWWCRGGGAAVVMLLTVVSVFRNARDGIFWVAVAFVAAHTAMSVRRFLIHRKSRGTATVIHHHHTRPATVSRGPAFIPSPSRSLLVPIKITAKSLVQQTKNPS